MFVFHTTIMTPANINGTTITHTTSGITHFSLLLDSTFAAPETSSPSAAETKLLLRYNNLFHFPFLFLNHRHRSVHRINMTSMQTMIVLKVKQTDKQLHSNKKLYQSTRVVCLRRYEETINTCNIT